MNNYIYIIENILLFLAIVLLIYILLIVIYLICMRFSRERKYIKIEMKRSTGREYRHWKKELRKLYLRSIPLVGRLFEK